jgi:hypothetical protein
MVAEVQATPPPALGGERIARLLYTLAPAGIPALWPGVLRFSANGVMVCRAHLCARWMAIPISTIDIPGIDV